MPPLCPVNDRRPEAWTLGVHIEVILAVHRTNFVRLPARDRGVRRALDGYPRTTRASRQPTIRSYVLDRKFHC